MAAKVKLRPKIAFLRNRKGVAAIEFALLGVPFFMILFAILETALIFVGDMTLEQAVERAGRSVRVGTVTKTNIGSGDFKKSLCREIRVLLSCDKVVFDLRSYSDFDSIPRAAPIKEGALDVTGFRFEPGNAGQIMALRAFYEWPLITNVIQGSMSNLSGGKYLLSASAVFQAEPF
ncbi:TadE/TadG family type IV pilus assembly protein [Aureimonas sp. Leaf427]|nr:TadE/TadG family type IV pilus assembly protein [Aureimonas sp. Leaf427]